jgi:membrane fusion protein, epimerase transport system
VDNIYNEEKLVKLSIILLSVIVFIFVFWGYFAPLKSVVVSTGSVEVYGKNKQIQHFEGGIVKKIFVEDGDEVKQGDILVELDQTQSMSQLNVSKLKKFELMAQKLRLIAQKEFKTKLSIERSLFNTKDSNYIDSLIKSQLDLFKTKVKFHFSQKNILKQKFDKTKHQKSGVYELLDFKQSHLESIKSEIVELETLYKEGLIDKVQIRELKRKKITIEGEISELKTKINELDVEMLEITEQLLSKDNEYLNSILDELREVEASLNDTNEKIVALKDKLIRNKITAPIDGVIQNKQIFTKGAVVRSAETIMEIVPKKQKLIINGKVDTVSIDQISIGQQCDIRFSAFDTQSTFVVDGIVKYISADKLMDQATNEAYYAVKIEPTKLGEQQIIDNKFILKAGMPVEAMIKTGSRTMISYLIQPFTDMTARAFNED